MTADTLDDILNALDWIEWAREHTPRARATPNVDAIRGALLADQPLAPAPAAEVMTVGAALADARVQDGSHVVEWIGDGDDRRARQYKVDRERFANGNERDEICVRWPVTGGWSDYYDAVDTTDGDLGASQLAAPCRLVPLADADRDPNERGALKVLGGGDALAEASMLAAFYRSCALSGEDPGTAEEARAKVRAVMAERIGDGT